jgi:para-aminobenzoate synthetase component 1
VPSTPFPPTQTFTVRTSALTGWTDPALAFSVLHSSSRFAIWLDAGANARSGMSYLAAAHSGSRLVTASAAAGTVTVSYPLQPGDVPVTMAGSIFDVLRAELPAGPNAAAALAGPSTSAPGEEPALGLGWVGWLGYGLAQPPGAASVEKDAAPDAAMLFVDRAIAFDHAAGTVTLLVAVPEPDAGEAGPEWAAHLEAWAHDIGERLAVARATATEPPPAAEPATAPPATAPPATAPPVVRWRHDSATYARLIGACQERIAAGDAYQLCLTNEVTIAGDFDPAEVYRRLRTTSPSHHGGYLRFGPHALLSASPEEFLSVSPGGRLRTKPIKGTRPRSPDPVVDSRLSAELLASDKERAENLMIVDLMRNDLGRVARLGSVAVTALLQVESYPHVHQLVSTVEAVLAPGLGAVDAIEACFPAGSMTGAPKASAMAILSSLEAGDRGVYAGAFGYLGLDGAVDLAMVIRSIVLSPTGASIGTGGGITALSVAGEEIEETRIKAAALIRAVLASSAVPAAPTGPGLVT